MRILFIGNFDIAGKYLSERLAKEGYDIVWATSEPVLTLWEGRFKGTVYRGQWRKSDYHRMINLNSTNGVVYMTGSHREHYEGNTDYKTHIKSLTDVLSVLSQYPKIRFIYFSSIELAYKGPYTPVLADLAAGEMLVDTYRQNYQIPVLILRFGLVYGNSDFRNMGFIGYELGRLLENKPIKSMYHKDSWIDTVYGEDAAEAVLRLMIMEKSGVYDICSGYPVTLEELYGTLIQVSGTEQKITYLGEKQTGEREVFQGSRSVKEDTGWMPRVLFHESGIRILRQSVNHRQEKVQQAGDGKTLRGKGIKWLSVPFLKNVAEVFIFYAVSQFILNLMKDAADFRYIDVRLLFVVLTSSFYGTGMGIFAAILACLSYGYGLSKSGIDISYLMYSMNTWIPFIMYGIAGALVGYIVDKKQDEKDAAEENYENLNQKYVFLKELHSEALEIKGQLQRQIMTTKDSFGKAYEVAVELDTLEPDLILYKVVDILESVMECDKIAVCLFSQGNMEYARLKACSPRLHEEIQNSISMREYPVLLDKLQKKEMYVNAELLFGYPDFAAPILHEDEVIGFIATFDIGADKFTLYYQNLFRILVSLVERNLIKALKHEDALRAEMYYPNTELLCQKFFEDKAALMQEQKEQFHHTFLKLKIKADVLCSKEEMSEKLTTLIRGHDFAGIDRDGDYAVILINADEGALSMIRNRFRNRGLEVESERWI